MGKSLNRGKGVETRKRKQRQTYGKRKKADQVAHGCPTPIKTAYSSFENAIHSINRAGNAGKGWGVYECICGWWHVTSQPGRLVRQFDEEFYRSSGYNYVPYNRATYHADKEAWNNRKSDTD